MANEPLLRMSHINKAFPGVKALDDVSLELKPGEVLALVGENGAGKSTLMKILSAAYTADSGEIWLDGNKLECHKPLDAIQAGVRIIYQELNYLPFMSVAENIFLGNWPFTGPFKSKVDYKKLREDSKKLLERVKLDVDPFTEIGQISVAEKQLVEIAKAISQNCKVLVMDEPTSSLNDTETENLFEIIRSLTAEGKSVIFISHRLDEIFEIADRIHIMRDGKTIRVEDLDKITRPEIVNAMVGREITAMYPKVEVPIGDIAMEVKGISNDIYKDVSFNVRKGEVLALFGLMGSGRTSIMESIYGKRRIDSGEIWINGKKVKIDTPKQAMNNGLAYLPAERKLDGLILDHSVEKNILLASITKRLGTLFLKLKKEREIATKWVKELLIKTPNTVVEVQQLSGGNQQKVVLAKALETEPEIILLNEPTRGIDVGAKVEIYKLIGKLCAEGKAVVMISSEIPEVIGVADRVVIVCEGRITGELKREELNPDKMLEMAIGGI